MFKRMATISVMVSIICLSGVILSMSASVAADQAAPQSVAVTQPRAQSEVLQSPPAEVLTQAPAVSLRSAYIASVNHATSGQEIEVWSRNVDGTPHMLFNHFVVKLADGSQVEESIGSEVRPGEWLHVTYRVPCTETNIVEFDVELTEPGPFFDYVHDCSRGLTNPS